jgi:hypothetical protein
VRSPPVSWPMNRKVQVGMKVSLWPKLVYEPYDIVLS